MIGKIFIDQLANGTSFIDEQQGDAMSEIRRYTAEQYPSPISGKVQIVRAQREHGPYVLWEDHCAEVERLKAENARVAGERDRARLSTQLAGEPIPWLKADIARLTKERDDAAQAERARCIRAIQRMPVPIDQADGAMRAIAAIEALETEDTP